MADEPRQDSGSIRTVIILGAAGYLGGALCRFFHGLPGHRVIAVARNAPAHGDFEDCIVADVFADEWAARVMTSGALVLINCAFDFKVIGAGDATNRFAGFARNLAALAGSPSTRLVNISTMSAYAGCRTDYGREKLVVENIFSKLGGSSVRPGLIGSWRRPGAAFANLIAIVAQSKVIPVLAAPGSGFYLCDLEAVVLGIYLLAGMTLNKPHVVSFCYRDRPKLGALLRSIEQRIGVRRIKLPLPWRFAYGLLLVKERLIGKSKVRADSVLDFAYPNPNPLRRDAFARIIASFRSELEALSGPAFVPDNFYYLEGPRSRAAAARCRLKATMPADIFGALGRLRDA
jgi:nucleoside-diphosphate-sugar epimerase